MSLALPIRWPSTRKARLVWVAFVLLVAAVVISSFHRRPRVWRASETPVAFWAWRNQTPAEADVTAALEKTKARAIFLRAGQIDSEGGKLRRIRPVLGSLPKEVDLHLVYNGTRSLLAQLEQIDESTLAAAIAGAYRADSERAVAEHARVLGLQIDIDFPTRLLGRYEKVLRALRPLLKPGTQLSITGLPTWMSSAQLPATLAQVDFWIPQLYGADIPERVDQSIPISATESVSRYVNQARQYDKPFYAGLAAFSWTLLYSARGSLISLRGDMDPASIAANQNLELIDQRPFSFSTNHVTGSEWRYVYRARSDGVIDELALHAGDQLVVDVPGAESLRLAARTVRESAGERLLGICVFRLPAKTDPATMTITEVSSALADRDAAVDVKVRVFSDAKTPSTGDRLTLEIKNDGAVGSLTGTVKIDLETRPGQIESVTPIGSASIEYLCSRGAGNSVDPEPCGQPRANVIRLRPQTLMPGRTVTTQLALRTTPPNVFPVSIELQTNDGQRYVDRRVVRIESRAEHER